MLNLFGIIRELIIVYLYVLLFMILFFDECLLYKKKLNIDKYIYDFFFLINFWIMCIVLIMFGKVNKKFYVIRINILMELILFVEGWKLGVYISFFLKVDNLWMFNCRFCFFFFMCLEIVKLDFL